MHYSTLVLIIAGFTAANAATIPSSSCGVKGYSKTNSYFYDASGAYATLAACGAKCKADSKCKSFGFGGQECDLYTQTVASNLSPDSTSLYIFYDVSCVGTTSSSTTVPSTSSKSTSGVSTSGSSRTTSTSTTITTPSTSSTSPTPTASLTCGVAAYDITPSYNYDASGTNANLSGCSAKCQADAQCLSFAVGPGVCLEYSVSAGSNTNPNSGSPYTFYDKNCPTSGYPSTTTTPVTTPTTAGTRPTDPFCLQRTGSGSAGNGIFVYYNTTNGDFMLPAETVNYPTQMFTIEAVSGALRTTDGYGVVVNPAMSAPNTYVLPLQKVGPSVGDPLTCSADRYGSLVCSASGGNLVFQEFSLIDGAVTTDQVVYMNTVSTTGALMDPTGFTIMYVCPNQPDTPPTPPVAIGFCGTTFPCPSSTTATSGSTTSAPSTTQTPATTTL